MEKHDAVIPWGLSGTASKATEKGGKFEIEYAVKALRKYAPCIDRIFVVGDEPPKSIQNEVEHICCDNPYTHIKDANIIYRIKKAIETVPDLSEDFLKVSDDIIVTRPAKWEDYEPQIKCLYTDHPIGWWRNTAHKSYWHSCLLETIRKFDLMKAAWWEPHINCHLNKYKWTEMCEKWDITKDRGVIDLTLYYNFIGREYIQPHDHLHINNSNRNILPTLKLEELPMHISWKDSAWENKHFRDILDQIIFENA